MGIKKNRIYAEIDEIQLKIYPMSASKKPFVMKCHHWNWAGPEETAIDLYRVVGGKLARFAGYCNVAAAEEV